MNLKNNNLFTLFCIIFLDLVGVGILIPVLAPIFLDPGSPLIPMNWTEELRNFAFGLLVAVYPLAQFFGAPILGTLSDRYGRKKILSLSLIGTLLGYLLFAYGLLTHELWLLYAGRILDGFTGGNISVANSAIADISSPKDRSKNFGLVGMAFGMGFIVGPFIGGILADSTIHPWFNSSTPFWFAAFLCFLNLLLVELLFKETIKEKVIKKIHAFIGFTHMKRAWKIKHLRAIFLIVFLHSLGFCFFTQFFPVFLVQKFNLQEAGIGLFFAYIGVWIAFCQGVLTRLFARRFKPEQILRFSFFGLSIAVFAMTLPSNVHFLYLIQPVMAVFEGLSFPNSTAVVSNLASETEQGEAMGITQSLRALGQAVPPLIAGLLVSVDQNLPTYTASVLILLAWAVFMISFRPKFLTR